MMRKQVGGGKTKVVGRRFGTLIRPIYYIRIAKGQTFAYKCSGTLGA